MRALTLSVRSLREGTRSKVSYLIRGLLIASLILAVWVSHQESGSSSVGGGMMLAWVAWCDFILICILAVAAFSAVITEEKELMTLGLLRLAGYTPASILLGKSIGLLVNVLLLLIVQVPFCMLAVTLGGVSVEQIVGIFTMLLAFTLFVYGLALFCSVAQRRNSSAARLTFAALIAYHFLPPILLSLIRYVVGVPASPEDSGLFYTGTYYVAWFLGECSSTSAFSAIWLLTSTMATFGSGVTTASFVPHTLVNASAGVALFGLSWLFFDRFNRNEHPAAPKRSSILPRSSAGGRRRGRVFTNALFWKDFMFVTGGPRWLWFRAVAYATVFALFIFMQARNQRIEVVGEIMMGCMMFAFPIEMGVQAGRLFAHEVKAKTLGSLVALPVSLGSIVLSKIAGSAIVGVPAICYFVIGAMLSPHNFADGVEELADEPGAWYFVSQIVLVWFLAAYLSLRVPRGAFPLAAAVVFLGNMICIMFLAATASSHSRDFADVAAVFGMMVTGVLCVAIGNGVVHRLRALASEE